MSDISRLDSTPEADFAVPQDGLRDISAIQASDSFSNPEIYLRVAAAGLLATILWALFELPLILPWFGGFLLGLGSYLVVLRRLPARIGRSGVALLLVSATVAHGTYAIGIFYLWIQPEQFLQILAVAALGLAMLHTQIAQRFDALAVGADAVATGLGILTMTAWQAFARDDLAGAIAFLALFSVIYGYYLYGLTDVARMRRRLQATVAEAAQMEKTAAIGRLTGGVAHDFNNMLTAILGNLDLLSETADRRERAAIVAEARGAARQAAEMVAQLLAFSRKAQLELRPVRLAEVIGEVRRLLDRLTPDGVTILLAVPPDLALVRTDAARLRSVVLHLCINAFDAMQDGGGLTLGAARRRVAAGQVRRTDGTLPPGDYVTLTVTDTGPGIPAAVRDRVFDPFYTTKPVGEGSGLGLSMAQGFLEQSGGAIGVEVPRAGGARIVLWLPIA